MSANSEIITVSASSLLRQFGQRIAVQNLDLKVRKGEILGLLGPNGAGKSTTMQMLTGNLAPTAGKVEICGIDIMDNPKQAKTRLGYLPENPPLYRDLTVDEFLKLAAKLHRIPKTQIKESVHRVKQRCGLSENGKRLIGNLSKGYQQRIGIAQAIIHNPDIVILDEPTVGLDPIQIREIRDLIRELGGSHSVILSTHILPEIEAVCDRVLILHQGKIVFNDTIEGLKQFRKGQSLQIGLNQPPKLEHLRAVPGVTDVESLSETLFRLRFSTNNPTEQLVKHSVEKGWGLYLLNPSETSLEDVFVQLTQREDPLQ